MTFTVTCAKGTEKVLAEELAELGLEANPAGGVVRVEGALPEAYRTVLWSRIGGRVLMPILHFRAENPDELYAALREQSWDEHMQVTDTLAVEAAVGGGRSDHSRFLAQRVKDAIVDDFRDRQGQRPSVDTADPDIRFHLHWSKECTLAVDLAGPLHRRGYRPRGAPAPLRETLAAALLRMSGWTPELPLFDPMCGSGTFLVEAACMAHGIAPGTVHRLGRWKKNDRDLFVRMREEALGARKRGPLQIAGSDRDGSAVELCRQSLELAGVPDVQVAQRELRDASPPFAEPGHVVVNPPYGERLGERGELVRLYPLIGDVLKQRFGGWQAHVLASDEALAGRVGLKRDRKQRVYNGSLECVFTSYTIRAATGEMKAPGWRRARAESSMFENRLRKNCKRLRGWAKGQGLQAYRVYDHDIPEYNMVVDRYGDQALLQEHRPRSVDVALADARLHDAILVTSDVLGLQENQVHVRVRHRHGDSQYEKRAESGERFSVHEGELRFAVNLNDYLDTGLFLDHRVLRRMCAKTCKAADKRKAEEGGGRVRFLNLFSYTCSASVYAATKGAHTTSVDLSGTYLSWGKDNFQLNELDADAHEFIKTDATRWLSQHQRRYDCILLAPPSYSRSKGMASELDLKRDHGRLIADAYSCLEPGGTLFFSTHARGFELDADIQQRFEGADITKATVPRDFPRGPHRTWRFVRT